MTRDGAVVVTGAASGMGAAVVAVLSKAGRATIGIDRHAGAPGVDVVVDLGHPEGRHEAVAGVLDRAQHTIAALVACAGLGGFAGVDGVDIVSVNHFGVAGLAELLRSEVGFGNQSSVVAIGSISATTSPTISDAIVDACLADDEPAARVAARAVGPVCAYGSSKLAIARWVRRHATEDHWVGAGIHVNLLAPGLVDTPLVHQMRQDPDGARVVEKFPSPRGDVGRAEEIASVVEFLVSPGARLFVGAILTADGGH